MECDTCVHYEYDEEAQEYYCTSDMDEDDYALLMQDRPGARGCPYWQAADEYAVVAHQAFAHGPNPDRQDAERSPQRRYHRVKPSAEFGAVGQDSVLENDRTAAAVRNAAADTRGEAEPGRPDKSERNI